MDVFPSNYAFLCNLAFLTFYPLLETVFPLNSVGHYCSLHFIPSSLGNFVIPASCLFFFLKLVQLVAAFIWIMCLFYPYYTTLFCYCFAKLHICVFTVAFYFCYWKLFFIWHHVCFYFLHSHLSALSCYHLHEWHLNHRCPNIWDVTMPTFFLPATTAFLRPFLSITRYLPTLHLPSSSPEAITIKEQAIFLVLSSFIYTSLKPTKITGEGEEHGKPPPPFSSFHTCGKTQESLWARKCIATENLLLRRTPMANQMEGWFEKGSEIDQRY